MSGPASAAPGGPTEQTATPSPATPASATPAAAAPDRAPDAAAPERAPEAIGRTPFGADPQQLRVPGDPALGEAGARVRRASVGEDPISVEEMARAVADPRCGAVVTFDGVVRDHDGGRTVLSLDYSAHPLAQQALAEAAREVAASHEDVLIALAHRIGPLRIGDTALACAVAAPHRKLAFSACDALVDEVKRRVPIWKHQRFADGESEWVGAGG